MVSRPAVLLLAILSSPLSAEVRDLKAFFQERCAICHGPDGSGRGPNGTRLGGPSLLEPRKLAKQEQADLVTSILKGRGAMPGFRRQIDAAEARQLLAEVNHSHGSKKGP